MRSARMVLALAGAVVLALSACGRSDKAPQLMNIRSDVPAEVIGVVTAIIILLVSSSFSVNFIKRLFRRGAAPAKEGTRPSDNRFRPQGAAGSDSSERADEDAGD